MSLLCFIFHTSGNIVDPSGTSQICFKEKLPLFSWMSYFYCIYFTNWDLLGCFIASCIYFVLVLVIFLEAMMGSLLNIFDAAWNISCRHNISLSNTFSVACCTSTIISSISMSTVLTFFSDLVIFWEECATFWFIGSNILFDYCWG